MVMSITTAMHIITMLNANLQTDDADSADYFGILSAQFLGPLDVAGYNYMARRYEKDLKAYPDRFICGTESVAKEALECPNRFSRPWKKRGISPI